MSANAPARYMQGIAVPTESVRPAEFFARTRRKIGLERAATFAGLGGQDVVELRKSDILAGATLRFVGTIQVTLPTGASVNTSARWPYDLAKTVRFTANGQSNIINVSGAKLKAREFMVRADLDDRGVEQHVNGATRRQGTLAKAAESWGVGSRQTAVPAGTYDVDLEWFLPVAEDQVDLAGAIFCATSSTDLTVTIDWESGANLFTTAGGATVTVNGQLQVVSTKYSIPLGADGQIVVPELSLFHSMIQSRQTGLATGENEIRLAGQGAGKSLLRCYYQVWNGNPAAPLAMNAANFGKQAWRYAGNETPDEFIDGQLLRIVNERSYNSDLASLHGFGVHEFAAENAFRDAVDMGTTAEFRLVVGVKDTVALTGPAVEYVQETIFQAGAGA